MFILFYNIPGVRLLRRFYHIIRHHEAYITLSDGLF